MNKAFIPWIGVALIAIVGAFMIFRDVAPASSTSGTGGSNVSVKNGVQYVALTAKGGYTPRTSTVAWGIPTKLIMKTKGAYDCSSSVIIKSLNYRQNLPPTGETEIDLGTPKSGEKIQGTCSMGMYSFNINVR